MSENESEPADVQPVVKPEPLKVDVPVYDYVEKGGSQEGIETTDAPPTERRG